MATSLSNPYLDPFDQRREMERRYQMEQMHRQMQEMKTMAAYDQGFLGPPKKSEAPKQAEPNKVLLLLPPVA